MARGVVSVTHPTAGCLQSIPIGPHAMQADAARLRGRPHGMLRARVVLDRAAAWTRLGVRVARRVRACVCARACVERVVGSIYNKQWKWPNV